MMGIFYLSFIDSMEKNCMDKLAKEEYEHTIKELEENGTEE